MPALGPYSKEIVLARPDGRSKEGRLLKQIRTTLLEEMGGASRVTSAQRLLAERAAMLSLRLAVFDAKLVAGTLTDLDTRTYLAWNNSLTRLLRQLGIEPPDAPPSDPMKALEAHFAARAHRAA